MGWLAWTAVIGGSLAVLVPALVLVLGRSGVRAGRAGRMAQLSRLAAGFSASWLGARLRRLFAGRERRARIDAATRERNARRLADTMGDMKGAFMKLGQMLSFVTDAVPAEYRQMLQRLQADAPPLDFPSIRDVIETELDRPLERAFASFDEEPIAAASIGQVHRATLPTGVEVAVKVQYPGIGKAIESDLANVGVLYRLIGMMYPTLDPVPIVAELRERISEELDYRLEAKNQAGFAELYRDHPFIHIPEVVSDYSTSRLLTSEMVSGRTFAEIESAGPELRHHYGEVLYRFVFGSSLRFRVFNGDPHPGNYMFHDDGRITFFDFGLTKYFPQEMMSHWRQAVLAYLAGDRDRFRANLVELDFLPGDSEVTGELLYNYFTYFYECWRADRDFEFTREYNAKSFAMIFSPKGEFAGLQKKMNMPRHFVFVNRIQWGVMSILASLEARANWHKIHREYMYGEPPSTDIGVAIADWRARWLEARGLEGRDIYLGPGGVTSEEPDGFPRCLSA